MAFVQFTGVSLAFGARDILKDAALYMANGTKAALAGPNGAGKTTLLRIVSGSLAPDSGDRAVQKGTRVSYLPQSGASYFGCTVYEEAEKAYGAVEALVSERDGIGSRLESSKEGDENLELLLESYHHLDESIEGSGYWRRADRIREVLEGLGFKPDDAGRPVEELSGGWQMRVALAKVILENPDIMLLDEPTNYLDLEGVAWLERWFGKFKGAIVVISHDRHFLDRVVKKVVEIENHRLFAYDGGYSAFVLKRKLRTKEITQQFLHEEELIIFEEEAVRERKATSGKQLGRRLADLKKRQIPRPVDQIFTSMYDSLNVPDSSLMVTGLSKSYEDRCIFSNLSFELRAQERLMVLGANGCGKSTLLNVLTGVEKADEGLIKWPGKGFSSFTQVWNEMDREDTVVHIVNVAPLAYRSQRKIVGRFLDMLQFSEKDQSQKIGQLSGGQQARVALALCLLSGAHTVVLDEPTNHLDLPSIQVMEQALYHFPGAVLAVSHDRFFIEKIATRMLLFKPDGTLSWDMDDWDALED